MQPSMPLITDPHLEAPDAFYEALIDTHSGLSEPQSHALNARLVLLLANHIGQHAVLLQALKAARDGERVLVHRPSDGGR